MQKFPVSSDKGEDSGSKWLKKIRKYFKYGVIAIVIVWPLFPNFFPYHPIHGFWFIKGTFSDWIYTSRYLLAWPIFFGALALIFKARRPSNLTRTEILRKGIVISLKAGIYEEFLFRWILFLGSMVALYVSNWILGGFLGPDEGIIRWFNNLIKIPVANWFTFGLLHDQIVNTVWYVGAALILTNGLFRDGHRYQGLFGMINSWFIGMFLFYLMFKHGLVVAMLIHFIYDVLCFGIDAIVATPKKRKSFNF